MGKRWAPSAESVRNGDAATGLLHGSRAAMPKVASDRSRSAADRPISQELSEEGAREAEDSARSARSDIGSRQVHGVTVTRTSPRTPGPPSTSCARIRTVPTERATTRPEPATTVAIAGSELLQVTE